jgi:hypothetical protein
MDTDADVVVGVSGGGCPALRWEAWVALGEGVCKVDLDLDVELVVDVGVGVSGGRRPPLPCPWLRCAALCCAALRWEACFALG